MLRTGLLFCLMVVWIHAMSHDEAIVEYEKIKASIAKYQATASKDLGIDELFKYMANTECQRYALSGHCIPNTVRFDPWVAEAMHFQTQVLSRDIPINEAQFTFTHNSFNDRSDGYGLDDNILRKLLSYFTNETLILAQQDFSMYDQLSFGVKTIMLDPHWVFGAVRMCHAGNKFEWFDKMVEIVKELFHVEFDFSSEQIGCTPNDRTWEDGMKELRSWLNDNPNKFLLVLINDSPGWDHQHTPLVLDPIVEHLSDIMYLPKDKTWKFPSVAQMIKMGKRALFMASSEYSQLGGEYIHQSFWVNGYPYNSVKYFTPYPHCGGFTPEKNTMFGGESWYLGPFYNGPQDMGLVTPTYTDFKMYYNVQQLLDCGINFISMDQTSPDMIALNVWTWAQSHPKVGKNCTVLNHETNRWESTDCVSQKYAFACQSVDQPRVWKESSIKSTDFLQGTNACDRGYKFAVPLNSYDARVLKDATKSTLWLNIVYKNGTWTF